MLPSPSRSLHFSILDFLHDHILINILDRLPNHLDRQAWSLCCKHFALLEAACRTRISLLRVHILPSLWCRYPHLQHLNLTPCTFLTDAALRSVAAVTGSRLLSLKLSKVHTFTDHGLAEVARACLSLTDVDLSQCFQLTDLGIRTLANLKGLKVLKLNGCRSISDKGLVPVSMACKHLQVLKLKSCLGITDIFLLFLASQCKELRELELSYTEITSFGLCVLASLNHLEILIGMSCNHIDDDGLHSLLNGCKSLQMLDVSRCRSVSHAGIISLESRIFSLQHICLSYCALDKTEEIFKGFSRFPNLQSIRLNGCDLNGVELRLLGQFCQNLKELSFCKCRGVTDAGLSAVITGCTKLTSIDLTCCREVSDIGLSFITDFCKNLVTLKMEACSQVSEHGFCKLSSCQYLEELDLTDTNLNDEGLLSVAKCRSLRVLKIGFCGNLHDEGLSYIASSCSKLKELDIYRSVGIGNSGIAAICRGCTELTSLNISYCSNICNSGLTEFARLCNLRVLEMRGCNRVSSLGLMAVAKGCSRLVELDVKHCSSLEETVPLALAQNCKNLKEINLCYGVATDEGLIALASLNSMQNMKLIHVKNVTIRGYHMLLEVGKSLKKIKLLAELKPHLPHSVVENAENRGCKLRWMEKTPPL